MRKNPTCNADELKSCFIASSFIETKDGRKQIKDIQVGDEVLTHQGRYKKVIKLYKNRYNGGFIKLSFGRKSNCFNRIIASEKTLILIERDNNVSWSEIKDVEIGYYVFCVGKKCLHCDSLVPYWMNYCKDYNCMDNPEVRKKLSDIRGGNKRKRDVFNNGSGNKHLYNDIIPFCDEKIKEGWQIVPVGAKTIPDAVGFKDGKVVLFELEKTGGDHFLFKKEKYTNSVISNYVDEIIWIDIRNRIGRVRNNYEQYKNGFIKIKVVDKEQKDSFYKSKENIMLYNLGVEEDESFVASHIIVKNIM